MITKSKRFLLSVPWIKFSHFLTRSGLALTGTQPEFFLEGGEQKVEYFFKNVTNGRRASKLVNSNASQKTGVWEWSLHLLDVIEACGQRFQTPDGSSNFLKKIAIYPI